MGTRVDPDDYLCRAAEAAIDDTEILLPHELATQA